MGKRGLVAAALVVAAVAVVGGRADAAGSGLKAVGGATIAPNTGNYTPAVASDGTETLVVWEKRNGQNGLADIYGRLTKTDATTSRTAVVRISLRAADEYLPDVAWNGSSFLVVWETLINGDRQEIHGRRVSKDGALLGSELAIATRNGHQNTPSVTAGANGQFLVAWEDDRNFAATETDIYARRVTSSGGLLDGTPIRVSTDTTQFVEDDTDPDIAWNGQFYLVVYTDFAEPQQVSSIEGRGVTPSGEIDHGGHIDAGTLAGDHNYGAFEPAVAASGKFFMIVWAEEFPTASRIDIRGVRWDALSGAPEPITISNAGGDQTLPTIAFNGNFVATWVDRRNGKDEIWGAGISSGGAVQDPNGFLVTNDFASNGSPALTKGSSKTETFTLAWEINSNTDTTGVQALGLAPAPK
jgi:hypothetical protein